MSGVHETAAASAASSANPMRQSRQDGEREGSAMSRRKQLRQKSASTQVWSNGLSSHALENKSASTSFVRKRSFGNMIETETLSGVRLEAETPGDVAENVLHNKNLPDIDVIEEENVGYNSFSEHELTGWRRGLIRFVESLGFTLIMTLLTIFALFGDDIRLSMTNVSADPTFTVLSFCTFIFFVCEFVILCLAQKKYINSFFFWLDLISVLSLIADIPFMWDGILQGLGITSGDASDLSVTRAGRASRVGTRAGRIVRFVRLLRLVRIMKLYKYCSKTKDADEDELADQEPIRRNSHLAAGGDLHAKNKAFSRHVNGSQIGKRLSDYTTRRVIIGVLLMLFVLPLLEVDEFEESGNYTLHRLETYAAFGNEAFEEMVNEVKDFYGSNLVYFKTNGTDVRVNAEATIATLRPEEISTYLLAASDQLGETKMQLSLRSTNALQATLSMLLTLVTIILLGVGALVFTRDAFKLVINPIERMVGFVRQLADNPLARLHQNSDNQNQQFETDLLESTLVKLGSLLQVGFGSAGGNVIAKNFSENGRALNPMLPGTRVNALFCFCDIRQFTDVTECLKESVMIFVNEIANIVHGCCHRLGGEANKNVGDAFLMVWRLNDDDDLVVNPRKLGKMRYHHIADQAVVAFIHCVTELMNSEEMLAWRQHQAIVERLPDWKVKVGVGLHWGWAIEGPIGSERKIDASYLSPNVDISNRLEEFTKHYGVPMLLSGQVFDILSAEMKQLCRLLDCVKISESQPAVMIYTVDIGKEGAEQQKEKPSIPLTRIRESIILSNIQGPVAGAMARQAAEEHAKHEQASDNELAELSELEGDEEEDDDDDAGDVEDDKEENEIKADDNRRSSPTLELQSAEPTPNQVVVANVPNDGRLVRALPGEDGGRKLRSKKKTRFDEDNYVMVDFAQMVDPFRVGISDLWVSLFNQASKLYIDGEWTKAVKVLKQCQQIVPDDVPTEVLLEYMAARDNVKPEDWQGYRNA